MSGERLLIVNADDFGRSPGINRGIVKAHLDGIVSSTTLMVNTEWSEEALELAESCPTLGIGLHLNLCYGRPVADPGDVPSLVRPDGGFETDLARLAARATTNDVKTETLAQLACFQRLAGFPPSHMDSHKYVHSLAPCREPILHVAARHGLAMRGHDEAERARMDELSIGHPDRFERRFHGLEGEGVTEAVLTAALDDVPAGVTELMCHPGFVDQHLMDSSYRDEREHEIEALCDPVIARLIATRDIRLVTFVATRDRKP